MPANPTLQAKTEKNLSSKPVCSFTCQPGLRAELLAQAFGEEQGKLVERIRLKPLVNFLMTYVVDIKVKHHYFHPQGGGKPHSTLETCEISKCKL